ncbi:aminodeoxychorismate synthase component I [Propionivibrio limicola]|uniref:aminodeoxychorismate synthase component I n=1 Tax=Propionivibrio limicola TaxID=167645 RepID=UPI001291C6E3|nr:aminodeoxychorismate synthase component I [Propionivibrio limicola]
MAADAGHFVVFDGDDGGAVLLSDYRRTLSFGGRQPNCHDLAEVFDAIEAVSANGEWVALAASYELGALFEPKAAHAPPGRTHDPLLRAWVFGQAQCLDAGGVEALLASRLACMSEAERVAGVAELRPSAEVRAYAEKVGQIRRWITEGDCYQINLTFPVAFRHYGHPLALYAALRKCQPVRYGGFVSTPEATLISLSPELFFERCGARVVTRPMKGTAPRGATPQADSEQRQTLLASAKERAENVMIVDLLRNDLGRLAEAGKVRVEALCEAEAYPTLWQMVSTIAAEIHDVGLFDLFRALFPCGSITGAPKIRAMQRIGELEDAPRGFYTGSLGWVAPGGDCRFNVAIRTLDLAADGTGTLGVGSGIVIDAEAEREYAECLLKARFLAGFDPGFELIETLRLEEGGYPLLAFHLDRLRASSQALGFACDMAHIREALIEHAVAHSDEVCRVRLTLAHSGRWQITSSAMVDDYAPKYAVLADEALGSDEYLLRHKTTARGRYDRVLKRLAAQPDVFDAIFFNTRGEVCEGARSNVFVERDGRLLTPPLACGLLPGVLRRQLLESGRAVEQVLRREDLLAASLLYLGNALRGLIPVALRV